MNEIWLPGNTPCGAIKSSLEQGLKYLKVVDRSILKTLTQLALKLIKICPSTGDNFAIRESHAAIRDAFEKNKQLKEPEQIVKVGFVEAQILLDNRNRSNLASNFLTLSKSIEMAEQAEEILRKEVMQARYISEDTVRINVRLDNVKDNRTFRFIDDD